MYCCPLCSIQQPFQVELYVNTVRLQDIAHVLGGHFVPLDLFEFTLDDTGCFRNAKPMVVCRRNCINSYFTIIRKTES
jgi:hypothetical protein